MKASGEESNSHITTAIQRLTDAGKSFSESAGYVGDKFGLELPSDNDVVNQALQALVEEKYAKPASYARALMVLAEVCERAVKELAFVRYNGDAERDMRVLGTLRVSGGKIGRIFVAISTLTRLSKG